MPTNHSLPEETRSIPNRSALTTSVMAEGIVLLHLQTSQYYSLNRTGTQIWQGIQAQQSVGELSRGLHFGADHVDSCFSSHELATTDFSDIATSNRLEPVTLAQFCYTTLWSR